MICKKILVKGRVHGVGFRYSTQMKAKELALGGYVKNTFEGVEIVAYGEELNVKKLIDWCKQEPSFSRVEGVDVQDLDEIHTGFKIEH
jgi:acylphosphatase